MHKPQERVVVVVPAPVEGAVDTCMLNEGIRSVVQVVQKLGKIMHPFVSLQETRVHYCFKQANEVFNPENLILSHLKSTALCNLHGSLS